MPETVVFILSTGRTGTKTLSEGLAKADISSPHQPPFSRLLTVASNYYLHGWLSKGIMEWLVHRLRAPQIFGSECRQYIQLYALDYIPAKIISQEYPDVYIVHIVRDPRTFVPSYINWMHTRFRSYVANKFVYGWHPSAYFTGELPKQTWHRMDGLQKVCWHWTYKNSLVERLFAGEKRYLRIRFEDLFSEEGEKVSRAMCDFIGVPYRDGFTRISRVRTNRSQSNYCLQWERWEPARKEQLLHICGNLMRRYGYLVGGDHEGLHSHNVVPAL